jgi:cytochrome c biogenesis protein CcmG/thiol:disulfide interchange protein DsbE
VKRPSAVVVLVVAGVAGLIGLLAYGVASQDPKGSVNGEAAPDFSLPPLDGGPERSLDDWRGQVVVLNYWASWCEPCRDESPLLERWHRRMRDRGGVVLGVDMLDISADAQDFIAEYKLTYPSLKDKDGDGLEKFGVVQYPETFVIDRRGRIAAVQRGPVDDTFMETKVEPLL